MEMPDRSRLTVLAPIVKNRKGTFKDTFARLLKEGYIRVRCDGEMRMLEDDIVLEKNIRHDIEVVIDRIIKTEDSRSRINDSLETALVKSTPSSALVLSFGARLNIRRRKGNDVLFQLCLSGMRIFHSQS